MKVAAPALLPILRSNTVGELLARTFLSPDDQITLTRLATDVDASLPTVTREINRMVVSGLLREERIGRARLVQANTASPLFEPLSALMALTYGPRPVLERLLAPVKGIHRAFIYGSWAARYRGQVGGSPNDVDVLVIGGADRDELFDTADAARKILKRDVSIRLVTPEVWDSSDHDPFLTQLRKHPLVDLELGTGNPES